MQARAHLKNARMSPRKLRLMAALVRGMPVTDAEAQLSFQVGKAAQLLRGVLKSAVANAQHGYDVANDKLSVYDVVVDEGIVMKRWQPRSRGMANPVIKRSSHITVVVTDGQKKAAPKRKQTADIETLTTDQLQKQVAEVAEEAAKDEKRTGLAKTSPSKQEEARGIMQTGQGGGNKKKTYRRKSIG